MKNLKLAAFLFLAFFTTIASAQTKKIDPTKCTIDWLGKKVTGQHNGTVNLKYGSLTFKNSKLSGGTFTVDMASLTSTDLQGEYLTKLNNHLRSEDFFGTEKFPVSKMVFTKIADKGQGKYTVTADLTIKDIKNSVQFDIVVKGNTASGKIVIDRTKYGIKYGSGSFFDNLGDKAIYDDFELDVKLQF
ncbi:MAG: YceI family protein [Saprospiraceae bacterium]|nr:YceI family protein [Saprospiraceae bacterium]